jgi:hypothetical protein
MRNFLQFFDAGQAISFFADFVTLAMLTIRKHYEPAFKTLTHIEPFFMETSP